MVDFIKVDEDILYFNGMYMRVQFQIMFNELNVPISLDEIRKVIKQFRSGVSAGVDLMLNEFLNVVRMGR